MFNVTPWPIYPGEETRYPLYMKLSGPQGRSGRVRKISVPLIFDPQTVNTVASRYTELPRHTNCILSTEHYNDIYIALTLHTLYKHGCEIIMILCVFISNCIITIRFIGVRTLMAA